MNIALFNLMQLIHCAASGFNLSTLDDAVKETGDR